MANVVLFNTTIVTGGTNQALDPSGVENLAYAQTLIIKTPSTNTGIIYVQASATAGATTGFPLAAGDSIVILFPTTGLFVNGTVTSDKYGVAGS